MTDLHGKIRDGIDRPLLDLPDIETEALARSELYRFELMSRSAYTSFRPDEIELTGHGGRVLYLSGVHIVKDRPLAVEQRLINLTVLPQAETMTFNVRSPGHWLLDVMPWTDSETRISADIADPETQRLFKAAKPLACLIVRQRIWKDDRRMTTVTQAFDSERYRLTASFKR